MEDVFDREYRLIEGSNPSNMRIACAISPIATSAPSSTG